VSDVIHAEAPVATEDRPPENMAWIPGGTFLMGSDFRYPEEGPRIA
jgi:formylglycine-generating enzyme